MLIKTVASAECVGCGIVTHKLSLKLSASVCGVSCERNVSDRIYTQLIEAEEVQPQGQLQARKRPELTQDKWRVSIT